MGLRVAIGLGLGSCGIVVWGSGFREVGGLGLDFGGFGVKDLSASRAQRLNPKILKPIQRKKGPVDLDLGIGELVFGIRGFGGREGHGLGLRVWGLGFRRGSPNLLNFCFSRFCWSGNPVREKNNPAYQEAR